MCVSTYCSIIINYFNPIFLNKSNGIHVPCRDLRTIAGYKVEK